MIRGLLLTGIVLMAPGVWGQQAPGAAMTKRQALALVRKSDAAAEAKTRLRDELVRDAALTVGTQGGYAERATEIRSIIDHNGRHLDRIFNFAPLLRDGRILAPVVEIVEDVLAVDDDGKAMRETARVLRVVRPARLVSTPPTWRDWLKIAPVAPQPQDTAAYPANSHEQTIWRQGIDDSWAVGRRHADAVYQTELNELRLDYEGMLRYHDLLAQGIIAPAVVGRSDIGIVKQDAELRVGDSTYTLRAPAAFQDASQWKPAVSLSESQAAEQRP